MILLCNIRPGLASGDLVCGEALLLTIIIFKCIPIKIAPWTKKSGIANYTFIDFASKCAFYQF